MISGIGHDIVQIPRIQALLQRYGSRFTQKCFTKIECNRAVNLSLAQQAAYYAKRFAAKEACVKALGTGFRDQIMFKDITIENDVLGKPFINLTGAALQRLHHLSGTTIHLSLSDDFPIASAFVVIEAYSAHNIKIK